MYLPALVILAKTAHFFSHSNLIGSSSGLRRHDEPRTPLQAVHVIVATNINNLICKVVKVRKLRLVIPAINSSKAIEVNNALLALVAQTPLCFYFGILEFDLKIVHPQKYYKPQLLSYNCPLSLLRYSVFITEILER